MKKINILEHVYECADDAYVKFDRYISQIHTKFENKPALIRDIELSIVEQLDFILSARTHKQLTKIDVDFLIQNMGEIEMLDDGIRFDEPMIANQQLYRDYDNRIFAGICAGIAAYFNISAWLVRFVFIMVFFTPIPILIPYLLMWYLIPPALTKSEKLNMRGIAVNLNSLVNYNGYTRKKIFHLAKLLLMIVAIFAIAFFSITIAIFIF